MTGMSSMKVADDRKTTAIKKGPFRPLNSISMAHHPCARPGRVRRCTPVGLRGLPRSALEEPRTSARLQVSTLPRISSTRASTLSTTSVISLRKASSSIRNCFISRSHFSQRLSRSLMRHRAILLRPKIAQTARANSMAGRWCRRTQSVSVATAKAVAPGVSVTWSRRLVDRSGLLPGGHRLRYRRPCSASRALVRLTMPDSRPS
jgi:hypothetical protein